MKNPKLQPLKAYESIEELQLLENNLKKSKSSQQEFYLKLQTIHELNQHKIGFDIEKFFRCCIHALFSDTLLKQITWSNYNSLFAVRSTQMFTQIQYFGSIINKDSLEGDRVKTLKRTLGKAKDCARHRLNHSGKY